MHFISSKKRGFTLIELLVVIAIIALLIALLLPAVQSARQSARRTQNRNNLKQIGLALHNYHDTHLLFPPGWIGVDSGSGSVAVEGDSGFGWGTMILPFLEYGNLYNDLNVHAGILDPSNSTGWTTALPVFRSPNDSGDNIFEIFDDATGTVVLSQLPTSNYVGNFGTTDVDACVGMGIGTPCLGNGVFFHNSITQIRDLRDGTAYTFMVGERKTDTEALPQWYSTWIGVIPGSQHPFGRVVGVADHVPNDPGGHFDDFSSQDVAGVQFLFGDGAVRLLNNKIDLTVYQAMATRAGKESVAFP
jgi:prepilin-type N-terminal cleavage/methylation domain-containing protein